LLLTVNAKLRGRYVDKVRDWTTTQARLVTAASFRIWPGWRDAYPRQPLKTFI